jgi:hypothetical protein
MAPLGVPTPQSAAPASPVPGFANSPINDPGIQSPAMSGQAVPAADPMAPLNTTAVPQTPVSADPMQNAPMPGYANLVPQQGPMAPVANPIAHAIPVPMGQPASVAQPQMVQPVSAVQATAYVEAPPAAGTVGQPMTASAVDGSPDPSATLDAEPSVPVISPLQSRASVVIPVLVGVAVGLLLSIGSLFWFLGDSDELEVVRETDQESEPFDINTSTTANGGGVNDLNSSTSNEGHDPTPSDTPPQSATDPNSDPTATVDPLPVEPLPPKPVAPEPVPPEPEPPKPEPPKPEPEPMPPQPSRADLVQLGTKLKSAREALTKHDYSAARTLLENAAPLVMLETHRSKFDRLLLATEYASSFHDAIVTGTTKLQAGEVLNYKGTPIGIVETSADRVILRVGGMNKRYALTTLPLGLAVLLAHQALSPTDATTIVQKACYVITSPAATANDKSKALGWFAEAATGLPEAKDLADFLVDDYDLTAGNVARNPTEMPNSPTTSDPATKPTRQEVMQLATALAAAREAIAARDTQAVETQLAAAEAVAKQADHKQKLWRLQRLAEHVQAFDEAMKEAVAVLNPGDVIKVGKSTELTVKRVNPASIAVVVAGLDKTYRLDNPPLGLAVALVQTKLSVDDPVTKAVQAAFVVVSKNSDERSLAKARSWYEESAEGNPDYADLGDVIDDDYDLLKDFQEQ